MKELSCEPKMAKSVEELKPSLAKAFGCKPDDIKLVGITLNFVQENGAGTVRVKLWAEEDSAKFFDDEEED